jgi:ABC-type Fe3+ transport system permease subunit
MIPRSCIAGGRIGIGQGLWGGAVGTLPVVNAARPRNSVQSLAAAAVVLAVLGAVVVFPAVFVVWDIARGLMSGEPLAMPRRIDLALFVRSAGTAAVMAGLATVFAVPAAWGARGLSWRALAFFLIPLMLPSYLAYSGWGLLRAPGTVIGDFLLRGPAWYPVVAGRVLAMAGLVLWVWPLAFLIAVGGFRGIDPAVLESLRLEAGPRWRKAALVLAMRRGSIQAAFGAVFLVLMGSAVPLHVAQYDTFAITIWRSLDEMPLAQHWRVWLLAWPSVALALAATFVIVRVGRTAGEGSEGAGQVRSVRVVWAAALWMLSVAVPCVLFATSIGEAQAVRTFWRVTAGAIVASLWVAGGVMLVGVLVAGATWFWRSAAGRRRSPVFLVVLGGFLLAGLLPGVLVGSSLIHAYREFGATRAVADTSWAVVLGHVARFGFLAVLAGVGLAAAEPREVRELRRIEAGDSFGGWARVSLLPNLHLLLACGLCLGLLSFQEIEASVLLQPPSTAGGSFAQKMLQNLHFARMQDLSVGVLLVTSAGLLVCAGLLLLVPRERPGGSP